MHMRVLLHLGILENHSKWVYWTHLLGLGIWLLICNIKSSLTNQSLYKTNNKQTCETIGYCIVGRVLFNMFRNPILLNRISASLSGLSYK